MDPGISPGDSEEHDRYPALTEHGRRTLEFLREHPHAPIFRNVSGHHLRPDEVARVKEFAHEVANSGAAWRPNELPGWLDGFIAHCFAEVPFYRKYGSVPGRFCDLPVITRADLSRDVAQFVPDNVAIDRLINFRTTGTTGHPLLLASHPVVAASYLAFHQRALRRFGIELRHGKNQVGVVLVGFQRKCFTYVSVTPAMDESGLAKINLHPDDWRNPDDRAKYLDALSPEVVTGDPISLGELARLPVQFKPRAVLSTSMALTAGFQQKLQKRFGCPVLDLYSMNEAGPVGVYDEAVRGHVLLQHRLYVEILDVKGAPVDESERGEIALTGGFNFCLPLLRYRTGDQGSLRFDGRDWVLERLEGRPPVMFRTRKGELINNIEVTHVLKDFALTQFTLHQNLAGDLKLSAIGSDAELQAAHHALLGLFGAGQLIEIIRLPVFEGKIVQYTSEIEVG